jgi:hypothetical protein
VRADPAWERLGAPPLPARLRLVRGPGNAEGGTVEAADGRSAAWQRGTWAAAGDTVRIELRADAGGDAALRLGRATSGWRGPAGWTAPGSEQREVSIWIVPDRCPAP